MNRYLVTGGAGFIGSNYVARLLDRGAHVTIYDNLTRAGVRHNIAWLRTRFGDDSFTLIVGDLRDAPAVAGACAEADVIVHLGGQVAVTRSLLDPRADFEANALGTFNLLEAARQSSRDPLVIYASTNKVYGGMEDVALVETPTRWQFADLPDGCPETRPLDFHSPYACSKGTGEQYARDYARIYGLRTVVFRQSRIYGPRQFGTDDQGWLAWMMLAALTGQPITIYGDGKQVRDVLHVDDLLDVYDQAVAHRDLPRGAVYNIGGGRGNVLAVWAEFGPMLERLAGRRIDVTRAGWRAGDQRAFYADITRARETFGWQPRTGLEEGIAGLFAWVRDHQHLLATVASA